MEKGVNVERILVIKRKCVNVTKSAENIRYVEKMKGNLNDDARKSSQNSKIGKVFHLGESHEGIFPGYYSNLWWTNDECVGKCCKCGCMSAQKTIFTYYSGFIVDILFCERGDLKVWRSVFRVPSVNQGLKINSRDRRKLLRPRSKI